MNTLPLFHSVVSKPAPDWNGTAVIKGEFKEMKLSDFKGNLSPMTTRNYITSRVYYYSDYFYSIHRKVFGVLLLPSRFVS